MRVAVGDNGPDLCDTPGLLSAAAAPERSRVTKENETLSFIKRERALLLSESWGCFSVPCARVSRAPLDLETLSLGPVSLGARMTDDELRMVLPAKDRLRPTALRVEVGRSVLLGGFGRVDLVDSELGAFFATFFVSNELTLHKTSTKNIEETDFVREHIGSLLKPPNTPERLDELGHHTLLHARVS